MTLARQLGLRMHLAKGTRHLLRRQRPMAAPSAALAGCTDGRVGREEKERVRARSAAVVALPACSMKLPLSLLWNAFNSTVFVDGACRDGAASLDGANAALCVAIDATARNDSNDIFLIIVLLELKVVNEFSAM